MSSSVSPARSRFGIRFSIVARRWRREIDAALTQSGVTDATWTPLVHLDETGGGITQKQLAALVGVDASTLVRLLDILEERQWVERRADAHDGRSRLVFLTSQGKQQVANIRARLETVEAGFLDAMADAEIADTLAFLDRLDDRLMAVQQERAGAGQ